MATLAREPFVLLVLALDALILGLRPSIFVRSDTWLALVAGRLVSTQWLPHHDTLTVWAHGHTWVDQQWLGQLAFYGFDRVGGLRLVLFVHVALLFAGFGLALAFARRSGGSSRSVAAVGVLALFLALGNSVARTQSFAYVFFVALFWLLSADVKAQSRRVLLALPLLVVWANVHGSAVLGAALVAVWAVASVVVLGARADRAAWLGRARAVGVAAAAFACLVVSPYGLGVVGYYRDVFGAGAFRDLVAEWGPSTLSNEWLFFVLAAGALWITARKPKALSLFEHLALVLLLFAGFAAVRNIVWFALAALMVVPRALDAVWPAEEAPIRRRVNLALSLGAIALIGASFVSAGYRASPSQAQDYPSAAARAVGAAAAHDPSIRVFANEAFADWLLWEQPALAGRVAFDARFELLTNAQLHALAHFRNRSSPHWLAAARGYRLLVLDPQHEKTAIRTVLAERGARSLYRDDHVAVLLRPAQR